MYIIRVQDKESIDKMDERPKILWKKYYIPVLKKDVLN